MEIMRKSISPLNHSFMSATHLKLAIRQLQKNKGFTALNIFGLSFGLATFLLIVLYVTDELSYDRYNVNADRIVRLNTDVKSNGEVAMLANAAPIVAATLRQHYPEVEATVRIAARHGMRFYKEAGVGEGAREGEEGPCFRGWVPGSWRAGGGGRAACGLG